MFPELSPRHTPARGPGSASSSLAPGSRAPGKGETTSLAGWVLSELKKERRMGAAVPTTQGNGAESTSGHSRGLWWVEREGSS